MNQRILIGMAAACVAGVILVACGGGSSSGGNAPTAMNMNASGVITGFGGGVFVNGNDFATDARTQVLDGDNDDASSSTSALAVGMTVDVDASGGSATMLRFTSAVRGEVDAIDTSGSTLTVLGQTVQITSGTSFAGSRGSGSGATPITQLSDVNVGDYVVVFGYVECASTCGSGSTSIIATLVDEPAVVGKYRVQGFVTNAASGSFTINGLTVDIAPSGASPTACNVANCAFANGDFVAVRSPSAPTGSFSATSSTLTLTATRIDAKPQAPAFAAGSTVTLEGPVSQLNGTAFVVRGIAVDGSGVASSVSALANNQIVEVTGTISPMGVLTATSITVERFATMTLMGPLDSVSSSTLSVLGQSFTVSDSTRFVDWAMGVRPFDASNFSTVLQAGDQVIVSGYPSSGGNIATRVERIAPPASPTAAVQGVVSADASSSGSLTVAGINVTIGSNTQLFYAGANGMPTATGFFAAIAPGTSIVCAFGAPGSSPGTIAAADAAVLRKGTRWMNGD